VSATFVADTDQKEGVLEAPQGVLGFSRASACSAAE